MNDILYFFCTVYILSAKLLDPGSTVNGCQTHFQCCDVGVLLPKRAPQKLFFHQRVVLDDLLYPRIPDLQSSKVRTRPFITKLRKQLVQELYDKE